MSDLLKNEELQLRVTCFYFNSEIDVKKKADLIYSKVKNYIPMSSLDQNVSKRKRCSNERLAK